MQGGDESDFSDDDVWAGDEAKVVPAQVDTKEQKHAKQGYVDGLANAKEGSLQTGFDNGYGQGAALGEKAGEILSTLRQLSLAGNTKAGELFETAKAELNIQNVLSVAYFDDNLDLEAQHKVIQKWEEAVDKVSQ
ncbi:hypothetical protein BABINDRAFT_33315 [Babjeviella inositovora NRRL Y-12698]|uniref:Protein YAE1 n=1 Tax=Babjeviella inositovora NRRL Y-12698 TaxID=984486 RepID=A0A1E3QXW7_9ASCO|nr:uncharacterized protein BABINDRAFT_33315 [Babjeviella inositovora NRRL Y-12698]ODQ81922.1 hypothetical protein BABINDRAFT_33315 [Babjeviella inositovora NRRL Y-12698]